VDVKDNLQYVTNQLSSFIRALPDFQLVEYFDGLYNHMGATITDAALQAGINYDTVVRPRVQHVRQDYPQASTTSGFLRLLHEQGAEKVLRWKHPEKPARAVALATFLQTEGVETETDLANWLAVDSNLPGLRGVRGVGPKTVDYLKILCGMNTAAVDRHMYAFLEEAGVQVRSYSEARALVNAVADEMGVHRAVLDHSIWRYMSSKQT
jgi:hypothetical protein